MIHLCPVLGAQPESSWDKAGEQSGELREVPSVHHLSASPRGASPQRPPHCLPHFSLSTFFLYILTFLKAGSVFQSMCHLHTVLCLFSFLKKAITESMVHLTITGIFGLMRYNVCASDAKRTSLGKWQGLGGSQCFLLNGEHRGAIGWDCASPVVSHRQALFRAQGYRNADNMALISSQGIARNRNRPVISQVQLHWVNPGVRGSPGSWGSQKWNPHPCLDGRKPEKASWRDYQADKAKRAFERASTCRLTVQRGGYGAGVHTVPTSLCRALVLAKRSAKKWCGYSLSCSIW